MHAGKALKGAHWHCRAAGAITGDIRVGGFPKEQHTFARVMGYVEQTDIHSPMVQAWRSLFFHRISGGFRYIYGAIYVSISRTHVLSERSFPFSCALCLSSHLECLIGHVSLRRQTASCSSIATDCLLPCSQLTVLESLVFSARLRHPASTPVRTVYAFVGEVRTACSLCVLSLASANILGGLFWKLPSSVRVVYGVDITKAVCMQDWSPVV